jgi:hypothetical protein
MDHIMDMAWLMPEAHRFSDCDYDNDNDLL